MNQAQQRFLTNRLDEALRSKPSRYQKLDVDEPKSVVDAREAQIRANRIIDKYGKSVEKMRDKRNAAIRSAFNAAKESILFSTSEVAIKEIEKFEKMVF